MITIVSAIIGFISSIFPQALKVYDKKIEYAQEIKILEIQAQLQMQGHLNRLEQIAVQEDAEQYRTIYKTFYSGVKWVDAFNALVRPVITFSFFGLYAYIKYVQFGYVSGADYLTVYTTLWGVEDQALFSSIIAFYFGNRTFNKLMDKR